MPALADGHSDIAWWAAALRIVGFAGPLFNDGRARLTLGLLHEQHWRRRP